MGRLYDVCVIQGHPDSPLTDAYVSMGTDHDAGGIHVPLIDNESLILLDSPPSNQSIMQSLQASISRFFSDVGLSSVAKSNSKAIAAIDGSL